MDASWFWPEGALALLMVGAFAFGAFKLKLPIAIAMSLAAVLGALAGGFGVPLRHLVEGMFGYIDTILIIACAMIFMKTVQHIGLLDALAAWGIRRFRAVPNDKHWVLPVTLEEAEIALAPFKLTSVGRALKMAMLEPSTTAPTSPEDALNTLRSDAALLTQMLQDLRDVQYLFNRDAATLGGSEKTLVMRCTRALLSWKG